MRTPVFFRSSSPGDVFVLTRCGRTPSARCRRGVLKPACAAPVFGGGDSAVVAVGSVDGVEHARNPPHRGRWGRSVHRPTCPWRHGANAAVSRTQAGDAAADAGRDDGASVSVPMANLSNRRRWPTPNLPTSRWKSSPDSMASWSCRQPQAAHRQRAHGHLSYPQRRLASARVDRNRVDDLLRKVRPQVVLMPQAKRSFNP